MFEFIADRPVLDFVATVSERRTARADKLGTAADLTRWVSEAALVDSEVEVDETGLAEARRLREAAYALISALIDDRPLPSDDLAVVNGAAAESPPRLELSADGRLRRHGGLEQVLAALARDVVDLAGGPDRELLHWCADDTCTRPFVDRSHGHRRRWCGMKGCGDRAKAAAYRRRRSGAADTAAR